MTSKRKPTCGIVTMWENTPNRGDEPAGLLGGHAQAQAAPTVKVAERLITLNVNGRQA
ncbi:hypothetical protein [uncultured Desulfobacter sp.]|uniref:hypothetical protein n=1 Tax=uncultured Desulfobacter sp. TaxID=240139 RepID=UPI002AA77C3D|nr:hypothetical protein [uncultured Desulfobacter sp.]